jgi:hypothetical protein
MNELVDRGGSTHARGDTVVSIREEDRATPNHIWAGRFSTTLWGYEKQAVDSFVLRATADYQLLLDATSEMAALTKQDSSKVLERAREAANDLLHAAKELAKGIRHQGREESARIRADAYANARAMKNDASQIALEILNDAEIVGEQARKYSHETLRRARHEVAQIRSEAIDETQAILNASHEKANVLSAEAEHHAMEVLNEAESEYQARLDRAQQLLTALDSYERRVAARLFEMELLVERLALLIQDRDSVGGAREPTRIAATTRSRPNGEIRASTRTQMRARSRSSDVKARLSHNMVQGHPFLVGVASQAKSRPSSLDIAGQPVRRRM